MKSYQSNSTQINPNQIHQSNQIDQPTNQPINQSTQITSINPLNLSNEQHQLSTSQSMIQANESANQSQQASKQANLNTQNENTQTSKQHKQVAINHTHTHVCVCVCVHIHAQTHPYTLAQQNQVETKAFGSPKINH